MLTLITGTPGAGKTAYAVSELAALVAKSPRPVVVMGIPELVVPHQVAPEVEQWTRRVAVAEDGSLAEAEFTFPEGALVVIDEAQKVFRPRATGSKVPDHVAAFEKHRHRGLDFWLITQHPNLLDSNVRRLVGKHIHLRGHWAGRELLEWPEATDPDSRSERSAAVRQRYTLPKNAFSLYKSASLHIKQKRRVPKVLYVVVVMLAVVGVLGWRAYDRIAGAIRGETVIAGAPAASGVAASGGQVGGPGSAAVGAALGLDAFTPRLRGRPESAPLYDGVRQVVAMPAVAGCAATKRRCTCVTEQGSDVGFSDAECRSWLDSPPFSPFRAVYPELPRSSGVEAAAKEKAPVSGPVGVLGAS